MSGLNPPDPSATVAPPLTLDRRLVAGEVTAAGVMGPYRRLALTDGEAHTVREDLLPGAAQHWQGRRLDPSSALACLSHITDLQLADVQSPARFEFFNREWADPRFRLLVPVQRPQEALTAHAIDATVRTLNRLTHAPASGGELQLAITTGDAIDNAQWNELQNFLALLDGGLVRPRSGGNRYEGVQTTSWPDTVFWRPDGEGPGPDGVVGPDLFRQGYAFPHLPGMLERALESFRSSGLTLPWLGCFGNHEGLIQGVGRMTPELARALVGGRKPVELAGEIDKDGAFEMFVEAAHVFLDGPSRDVTADADRRPVSRREFVEAHLRNGSRPFGHGFDDTNVTDGTAYYSYDAGAVRYLALDTTVLAGGADGALDVAQLRWLEQRLVEVHSRYRAADGSEVTTGAEDRLVVLFSHHGLDTLTNERGVSTGLSGDDMVGAPAVEALVHRFGNVILWINGHTHTNGVRARRSPYDPTRGFWDVTTCAVVDWPCQTRVVEIVDGGDGTLAVIATMVDHDSPLAPGSLATRPQLAGLHREIAANVPWAGAGGPLEGTPTDRNVVLPLTAPFPLHRLPH